MQRALVTGATGFIGQHLMRKLAAGGIDVLEVGRGFDGRGTTTTDWSIDALALRLRDFRPDVVFHLAGAAAASDEALARLNVGLTRILIASISASGTSPVLLSAGSAAEYGSAIADGVPVREDAVCRPMSAYGRSKLAQSEALLEFAASYPCRVVVARIFNPIGVGMPPHLALGSFARQIASMGNDGGVLGTGNLDVNRDFIDVDVCAGLLMALAQSTAASGIFNVCRGDPVSLRCLVEMLIAASGRRIVLEERSNLKRDGELQTIIGSTAHLATVCTIPAPSDMPALMRLIWSRAWSEAQASRDRS